MESEDAVFVDEWEYVRAWMRVRSSKAKKRNVESEWTGDTQYGRKRSKGVMGLKRGKKVV